jgi:hypothetical protein
MRQNKLRLVTGGLVLVGFAIVFFLAMTAVAACSMRSAHAGLWPAVCPFVTVKSNDPVAMMQVVGETAGAAGGLGIAMIIAGVIRKIRNRNSQPGV